MTEPEAISEIYPQSVELDDRGVILVSQQGAVALLTIRDTDPDQTLPALPRLVPAGFYQATIEPVTPVAAVQAAQARRTLWQGFLQYTAERLGRIPTAAEARKERRLDWLLSRLQEGSRLYRCQILLALGVPGLPGQDPEEIRAAALQQRARLAERLRAAGYMPQIFAYIPLEGYQALFPHGPLHEAGHFFRVDEGVEPLLPIPEPLSPPRPGAVYLGESERGSLFFAPESGLWGVPLPHGSTIILGEMGSRKTTLRRVLAMGRWLWGRAILTLDPKGEDRVLVEALGGRQFRLRPPEEEDRCWMHPFAGLTRPEELFLAVRTFWSAVIRSPWPAEGDAVLNRVLLELRREGRMSSGTLRLRDLAEALAREGARSPVAATMAAMLAPYAEGGVLSGYFDRPRADLDRFEIAPGDWISFDLSGLRDETARSIAVYALSWFLYRAVLRERQLPLDVFIDEGWRLLTAGSSLPDELARELRGRGGTLTLITHLPGDLSGTVVGSLASFAFLGRMPARTARDFLEGMGVPDAEALSASVPALPPGTFLALAAAGRGQPAILRLRFPESWLELFRRGELR